MFDFISVLSRYYFIFLIAYFLWLGVRYILGERGITNFDLRAAAKSQRILIILTILFAFPLLAYRSTGFPFDLRTLLFGLGVLVFVVFGFFTSSRAFKNSCPLMWNGMFFLLTVGLITLQRLNPDLALRQLLFAFFGFLVTFLIPITLKIVPKFEKLEILYLILCFALMGVVFIMGTGLYGATNWLKIFGMSFQPSEFVKVLFVFYLASALRNHISVKKLFFVCFAGAIIILMLVMQKDLGGALIFFMTFMIMLYTSTGSELLFILGFAGMSGASVVAYQVFDHVKTRVTVWQNPWADVSNKGYQLTQSLFAICSWGPVGSGLNRGYAAAIPVVERDFIFAAICEEFGSLFGLLLIGVFMMVFYRGVHIALRCKKPLYSLLSVGFTGILAFQTFVILGGDIKLIPMTGVTLPFVSYGGTSVFISIIMIGVLEWLYSRIPEDEQKRDKFRKLKLKKAKPKKEHEEYKDEEEPEFE